MISAPQAETTLSIPAGATPFVEVALVALCGPPRVQRVPAVYSCGWLSFTLDLEGLAGTWAMTVRAAADAVVPPGGVIFEAPLHVYARPC